MIEGDVQGVGYRYSMRTVALQAGVKGWVRNCRDGSVEAVVQGAECDVNSVIEWAWHGPQMAHVKNVLISEHTGDFSDFSIRDSV